MVPERGIAHLWYLLASKAAVRGFVFVSDVPSHTGRGGEGALTLVTRKLLQTLYNKKTPKPLATSIHLWLYPKTKRVVDVPDLAMLFSHVGNVVFPVRVACVARRALPAGGGLQLLRLHFLFAPRLVSLRALRLHRRPRTRGSRRRWRQLLFWDGSLMGLMNKGGVKL